MKRAILLSVIAALAHAGGASLEAKGRAPDEPRGPEVYNITEGRGVEIAAKKPEYPLTLFGESGKSGTYVPSGYMGDSGALKLLSGNFSAPLDDGKEGQSCLKVKYTGKGAAGWAGVYWLSPANNWAKIKGAGYDVSQSPRLTFWAKGEKGGERIAEAKVGGIVGPYPDTDSASAETIKLTDEWKQYEIDLKGKDMRHIVGGFMFVLRRVDNPRGALFYLDEIRYEGPAPAPEADQPSASAVTP